MLPLIHHYDTPHTVISSKGFWQGTKRSSCHIINERQYVMRSDLAYDRYRFVFKYLARSRHNCSSVKG
jgi:hypothetical protein